MLKHDHYYRIGATHLYCEDYVTQGDHPTPFIVLSDGCSSSVDTDLGARILTNTVKKIIERYLPVYYENDTLEWSLLPDYKAFGQMVIMEAQSVADLLNLDSSALDATLLVAFHSNGVVHVYVYGDGYILLKDRAGQCGYIEIEFTDNTPYYLSYWRDKKLFHAYQDQVGGADTLRISDSMQHVSSLSPFNQPLSFSFPLEQYQAIAIASDGVSQLYDSQKESRLPVQQVAETLLDFKGNEGDFVKRRMARVLQTYGEAQIFPLDDLSLGAFLSTDRAAD
jgi:hypothetical protein